MSRARAWYTGFGPVQKGGPGSGHYGHKGVPGRRGGSMARPTISIVEGGSLSQDQIDMLRGEISSEWEGERKSYALGGFGSFYHEGNKIVLIRQENELVGIGTLGEVEKDISKYMPSGSYAWVRTAATKRSGYGRELMQALVDQAKAQGSGIALISDPQAAGFYRRLGMREVGPNWDNMFYWTVNDL